MKPPTVIHYSPKRKASGLLLNSLLVAMCASGWATMITLHPLAVCALFLTAALWTLGFIIIPNESPNEN